MDTWRVLEASEELNTLSKLQRLTWENELEKSKLNEIIGM